VQHTLADGMAGKNPVAFTKESDHLAYGQRQGIPNVKCQAPDAATNTVKRAGFNVVINATPVPSDCPPGTVAGTTPNGTTSKGGVVTLNISAGPTQGR